MFGLGGIDAILGAAWLQTFGDVRMNWAAITMFFNTRANIAVWWATPLCFAHRSPSELSLEHENDFLACPWPLQTEPPVSSPLVAEFRHLLEELPDIFSPPQGLPPVRPTDHAIVLQPGVAIVSVYPYGHEHALKYYIEFLVQEMLLGCLIRPTANPFSSWVLLVRKKDGSWRFCVDNREVNKVTVLNKYPIPVIQELSNGFHGAAYFTKLDLQAGYNQIQVRPNDVSKTAFRTHADHFDFLVMSFGLTNTRLPFKQP